MTNFGHILCWKNIWRATTTTASLLTLESKCFYKIVGAVSQLSESVRNFYVGQTVWKWQSSKCTSILNLNIYIFQHFYNGILTAHSVSASKIQVFLVEIDFILFLPANAVDLFATMWKCFTYNIWTVWYIY